ncbi:MAG: 5-oxoprolinase subunit PxpB [Bacteroidetes bacterium]|nr:5-oxoprolinase subunit PxpB [Bacteroidota bacterium]
MDGHSSYKIFPLGDQAITIDFGNRIDDALNDRVMALYEELLREPLPGMVELVPAFCTLTVYYDVVYLRKMVAPGSTAYECMYGQLESRAARPHQYQPATGRLIEIPVCYVPSHAPDMEALVQHSGLTREAIIHIHTAQPYRVYMMGFLPGFAYMGPLDERIQMPRKSRPHNIVAGSVGIAGRQTGIYPLASPGGWQIIGRTPMKLFDEKKEEGVLFKAGDRVTFYEITEEKYKELAASNETDLKLTTYNLKPKTYNLQPTSSVAL